MRQSSFLHTDFARHVLTSPQAAVRVSTSTRLRLIHAVALLWVLLLVGRLYTLQISDHERWEDWALRQHSSVIKLASERGPIYDRSGKLLAVSVPAASIYVRPGQIKDKHEAALKIAEALNLSAAYVRARLDEKQPFVWIKRQLPRVMQKKIEDLGIKGAGAMIEARRFYPNNQAASTLIGKVGVDGNGLSGIEKLFEEDLHGEHRRARVGRDALGKTIEIGRTGSEDLSQPQGAPLTLTIDSDLQLIADEELEAGRKNSNAKAAMAVLLDAESGEVLALSQAPTVNFNNEKLPDGAGLKNLVLETVFEPGSIMKPLIAAAALEEGILGPESMIDCENGSFRIGTHTVSDVHPNGVISLKDVIVQSSNIGMSKVGMKLGAQKEYEYLRHYGFGSTSGLGLPGETAGILRPVSAWAQVDVATHAYGQGVAVTPLQVVRAVSAIANGGLLPTVSVIKGAGSLGQRILSESTAGKIREMMYGVVEEEHGTGQKAAVLGVRIGGKTGTAQKARSSGRGYEPGSYIASFVGFVDAAPLGLNRKLTLLVSIDQPNTTTIYGGTLAAPVFRRIMQRSLQLMSTLSDIQPRYDDVVPDIDGNSRAKLTPVSYKR